MDLPVDFSSLVLKIIIKKTNSLHRGEHSMQATILFTKRKQISTWQNVLSKLSDDDGTYTSEKDKPPEIGDGIGYDIKHHFTPCFQTKTKQLVPSQRF